MLEHLTQHPHVDVHVGMFKYTKGATLMDSHFVLAYKELKWDAHQLKLATKTEPSTSQDWQPDEADRSCSGRLSLSFSLNRIQERLEKQKLK